MELVSVIIPVYQVEPYLDRCVQSVVNQTYPNLEIILVDDGSPDQCPAMCDAWAERDPRIRVIHKQNGGVSSARNEGIEKATGQFVFFLDSDDFLSPDCLETLVSTSVKYHADIVFGNRVFFHHYNCQFPDNHTEEIQFVQLNTASYLRIGLEKGFATGKLFQRKTIGNARFDEKIALGEDCVFIYLVLSQHDDLIILSLDKNLYYYLNRSTSASSAGKGLLSYYNIAHWCFEQSIKKQMPAFILLEGFKSAFIYRYEYRNERNTIHSQNTQEVIREGIFALKRANSVSPFRRIVFFMFAKFPFLYETYVWIRLRKAKK